MDLLVDKVVVGHEDKVSGSSPVFIGKIRAVLFPLSNLMELFDVHRPPRHLSFTFVTIFVENARIKTFLRVSTGCIEREALVHVDCLVHAEMVTGCN